MTFNVCICFDLILMIKHPFVSKSKRIIRYHIVTYTVSLLAVAEKLNGEILSTGDGLTLTLVQVLAFMAFVFMGLFSSLFALNRLCKPGISREVRVLILKRHISYILAYFACNFYLLIQGAQQILLEYKVQVASGTWWINTSEILYFS